MFDVLDFDGGSDTNLLGVVDGDLTGVVGPLFLLYLKKGPVAVLRALVVRDFAVREESYRCFKRGLVFSPLFSASAFLSRRARVRACQPRRQQAQQSGFFVPMDVRFGSVFPLLQIDAINAKRGADKVFVFKALSYSVTAVYSLTSRPWSASVCVGRFWELLHRPG